MGSAPSDIDTEADTQTIPTMRPAVRREPPPSWRDAPREARRPAPAPAPVRLDQDGWPAFEDAPDAMRVEEDDRGRAPRGHGRGDGRADGRGDVRSDDPRRSPSGDPYFDEDTRETEAPTSQIDLGGPTDGAHDGGNHPQDRADGGDERFGRRRRRRRGGRDRGRDRDARPAPGANASPSFDDSRPDLARTEVSPGYGEPSFDGPAFDGEPSPPDRGPRPDFRGAPSGRGDAERHGRRDERRSDDRPRRDGRGPRDRHGRHDRHARHDAPPRPVHDDEPLAVLTPPPDSGIIKIEVRREPPAPEPRSLEESDPLAHWDLADEDLARADRGVRHADRHADDPHPHDDHHDDRHADHHGDHHDDHGPSQGRDAGRSHDGRRGPRRELHGVHHFFAPERLEECQRAIGYHFRDIKLLENALTHSSIKSEGRPSYERLEFLGDSVVGLVIAERVYLERPDFDEGELTKVKSLVVSTEGLANAAEACGLDKYLAVGRGILMKNSVPRSLIADVFEGVIGAVFIDRGWEAARLYVLDQLLPFLQEALSDRTERNFKSVLQQVAQRDLGETPHYEIVREAGRDRQRQYEVVAVLGRRRFPAARAETKKDAEQAAAKLALRTILKERGEESPRRRGSRDRRRRSR